MLEIIQELRNAPSRSAPGARDQISVCHIASGDGWGGAEVQVAALLKALARRGDIQLSAILLNEGRLANELREHGITVKVIPEETKWFPEIISESVRFVRQSNPAVLHSHRYKENLLAALVARQCGTRCLVRTQHGRPERFSGFIGIKQRLLYAMDRKVQKYADDCVVSVSAELTGYLHRYMNPSEVAVVRNGIDIEQASSALTSYAARERLAIPGDVPVIGTAARIEATKRLDLFLLAAKRICHELPDARFLIAGDGRQLSDLQELAQEFGLENKVQLLGHRNDIHDVLRAMDVLLITSDIEGLPMVMLEAMAMEVPVVARKVGGIPEVIQDGVSGLLVPSPDPSLIAEAVLRILSDKKFCSRLTEAAFRVVATNHSAENNAATMADLYSSLLKN